MLVATAFGGILWVFVYPLLSGERRAAQRQKVIHLVQTDLLPLHLLKHGVRALHAAFHPAVTAAMRVLNGRKFYVNDASTAGDQYCTAIGSVSV